MNPLRRIKNIIFKRDNYKLKQEISRYIKTDSPIIVEAGAHIGSDTCEMSKVWPKGVIHAFEPIPEIFKKLKQNTKGYKNIITYPLALSNQTGTAEIFVSSGSSNGSSSLLAPKEHLAEHPDVLFDNKIKINTITLDDWASTNKVSHVDFLWLDMQGYELTALKSGEAILKTTDTIYMEVFLKQLYEGAPLYQEVRDWLEGRGFKVEKEEMDWDSVGNVLFVRNN